MSDVVEKPKSARRQRKEKYAVKLEAALQEYHNILIVGVDNVGSSQMQKVRIALRGKAIVLMGKNTLMRKIIREQAVKNPKLEALLPFVFFNVGFVFTNHGLAEVRNLITSSKVPAAAKSGSLSPSDVFIPPGPTGMDPGQTNFFQALNIATKIVKGTIEIINQVHLIKTGEKVTASHVALLTKLNILPFFYGFKVSTVYEDGVTYDAAILDQSKEDLLAKFFQGVQKVAAVSLAIGHANQASLPHIVANAFKKLVAISLATDYTFEQSKQFKEYLANPEKFAAAAAPAAASAAETKKEEPKKESSEESGGDMGFSLFD
jgi:large subunit ribosomal protein LP0